MKLNGDNYIIDNRMRNRTSLIPSLEVIFIDWSFIENIDLAKFLVVSRVLLFYNFITTGSFSMRALWISNSPHNSRLCNVIYLYYSFAFAI